MWVRVPPPAPFIASRRAAPAAGWADRRRALARCRHWNGSQNRLRRLSGSLGKAATRARPDSKFPSREDVAVLKPDLSRQSDQPLSGHPRLHPGGTRCLQTPCTRLGNRVKPLPKRLAPVRITPLVHINRNLPGFGSVGMVQSGTALPTKVQCRTGDNPVRGFKWLRTRPYAFTCKLSPAWSWPRVV